MVQNIKYKVIDRTTRKSSNWAISYHRHEIFHRTKSGEKYTLTYRKGAIVQAPKNTLGIFVFEKLSNAKNFIQCVGQPKEFKILRVKPIGHKSTPKYISRGPLDANNIDIFYEILDRLENKSSIYNHVISGAQEYIGSVCYQSVEVLE